MTVQNINKLLASPQIVVTGLREHNKASEKYVDVKFTQDNGFVWESSIPYYYRRTGLLIEKDVDLAEYLKKIRSQFAKYKIAKFVVLEKKRWDTELKGKKITKSFFDKLINLKWNSVEVDLPANPNWARRIQDIKDFGYTLATNTNMNIAGTKKNGTHIMLIPIPKGGATGYEVMSPQFKEKVIKTLNGINVYEQSAANKQGLIPDHKFSEIRWDDTTKAENSIEMEECEIIKKFQLLDNQRNQQKREVCRNCFQTGKRGIIYGINYFYAGDENWDSNIPKIGKDAEQGCVGCGWYDISTWRDCLNAKVKI